MMLIWGVSGSPVKELNVRELEKMVETGKSLRELKLVLAPKIGASRFRQKCFGEDLEELQDEILLGPLVGTSVRLILVDFCDADETMALALVKACVTNCVGEVERFLQRPMNPGIASHNSGYVCSFHIASVLGYLDVVRLLLEAGVDIEQEAFYGLRALHFASLSGSSQLVRMLVEAGAKIEAKTVVPGDVFEHCINSIQCGLTNLQIAALAGHGIAPHIGAQGDETALHLAAGRGYMGVVRLLIESGAEKNAASDSGKTALHYAALNGHLEVAQFLLDVGADQRAKYVDGRTTWRLKSVDLVRRQVTWLSY